MQHDKRAYLFTYIDDFKQNRQNYERQFKPQHARKFEDYIYYAHQYTIPFSRNLIDYITVSFLLKIT